MVNYCGNTCACVQDKCQVAFILYVLNWVLFLDLTLTPMQYIEFNGVAFLPNLLISW